MVEKEFLNQLETEIQEDVKTCEKRIEKEKADILRMKQFLYDSTASDMDEAEVISGMEDIDHAVHLTDMVIERMDQLKRMQKNPYFAYLRFQFDDDGEVLPLHIGNLGYYSKKQDEQLIFDWRAPVSALFYDYEKGGAGYLAPMGEITGDILEKKQIGIEDGKLLYVVDTDATVRDDLLVKELSKHSSEKMHAVVATIQKEQNLIIRNQDAKTLVVDGRAGSGKTVVGLHRIAWLLYNNRKTMTAEKVLILSPNGVFSDYISNILPELGEHSAPEKEWDSLLDELLFLAEEYETKMDQAQSILEGVKDAKRRMENIRLKSSIAFYQDFHAFLENYAKKSIHIENFRFEKTEFPAARIEILFHETFRQYPIYERFYHIANFIVDEVEEVQKKAIEGSRREKMLRQIQTEMIIRFAERNLLMIYQAFLAEEEEKYPGVSQCFSTEGKICYEDAQIILYLQILLYGCKSYEDIKHLLVDEMQDYNIFQYAIMEQLFPCKKTILGDQYQVLFYNEKETVLDAIRMIFPEMELETMNTSYRSTREITRFANRIIGKDIENAFGRSGREPELVEVQDEETLHQSIETILEDLKKRETGYENIAILTEDEEEAGELYQALIEKHPDLSLTGPNSAVYFGGLSIMTQFFAKGMEFDVAIVLQQKTRSDETVGKQEFYISCTRALHELYVVKRTS